MVYRHEGVYDGRYKLIHYYDVDEWELLDTKCDPLERKNVVREEAYAPMVQRLKNELGRLRSVYGVPPNEPKAVENVGRHYHSDMILKRQNDRR
jgi:hypothetical protein